MPDDGPTKTELNKQAAALDIPGRSKMDEAELATAIAEASAAQAEAAAAAERDKAATYTRTQLAGPAADQVGHPGFVIAGALDALDGDHDLTIAETQDAVEHFLQTPVTTEEA